jgi:hypothetical protein
MSASIFTRRQAQTKERTGSERQSPSKRVPLELFDVELFVVHTALLFFIAPPAPG